jgi:NAD(P)-dependent dehydrogenase (short-subunit alcohol dehydrogenase family)
MPLVWAQADYGELEALDAPWTAPRLDGAAALVTGAAAGIGKAVALRLHEVGASLVVCDLDDEGGAATAAEVAGAFIHADVAQPDDLRLVFQTAARPGPLRIVVNNAGGTSPPHFPTAIPTTGDEPLPSISGRPRWARTSPSRRCVDVAERS